MTNYTQNHKQLNNCQIITIIYDEDADAETNFFFLTLTAFIIRPGFCLIRSAVCNIFDYDLTGGERRGETYLRILINLPIQRSEADAQGKTCLQNYYHYF